MKERLIGAAVLVLIGVLVIPWILDGRGSEQESGPTALRLPAPDEPVPVRTETIEVGRPLGAKPAPPVVPPVATPASERQVATADVTRGQEPPAAAPANPPPAAASPSTATPPIADEPAASTPSRAASPAAAPPKPAATAASTARPPAKGAWTVQLGSFGDEDNARKLAQRASTYGYKPAVSAHKSNGRVMYRVRVGSYDNRAEAGATASGLSAHGITAQVVAAD